MAIGIEKFDCRLRTGPAAAFERACAPRSRNTARARCRPGPAMRARKDGIQFAVAKSRLSP